MKTHYKRPFFLLSCFIIFLMPSSICFGLETSDVRSDGGLVLGSRIVKVTSLADDGSGSLRQALRSCGPCVIVFDVTGAIDLQLDLTIDTDHVTIAGETAPSPGIVLHGGTLRIRSSDVVISHISIYPGSSPDPKIAEKRDGISTYGSPKRKRTLRGIILQNVSVGWGVDENIGLQGLTDGVRIERALIAQPLRLGGHPKGVHSMNIVLGNTVGRVIILGSVFAASEQRSPRLTTGNRVTFMNNLIVFSGAMASHLDTSTTILNSGAIDMIGNAYISGPFTNCKNQAIRIENSFLTASPPTSVFLSDNLVNNDAKENCLKLPPSNLPGLAKTPQTHISGWNLMPASSVQDGILQFAGSHPLKRNPIDEQVVQHIKDGTLRLPDNETQVGGFPVIRKIYELAAVPHNLNKMKNVQEIEEIQTWLCGRHKELTGLSSCL